MRGILFWLLVTVLGASLIGIAVFLMMPRTTKYHPDFGQDCTALLTPATENAVDCVRVFYGTNRTVKADGPMPGPEEERDTASVRPEDGQRLHLGRADVWLPKLIEEGGSRERGETPYLEGRMPDEDSELAKYVFLTRVTTSGRERFLVDLDDALIDQNSWSLLLFVHGFNTPFEDALIRSAQLSVDLSRREVFDVGVPVLFSWPSAGKVSLDHYNGDRDRSFAAAPYLEQFLDLLTDEADIERINIVAHSMGNRILTRALEDYAADYLERHGDKDLEFRIILVAADVDRDIFDATTGILDNLEANVTIYTSDSDRALQVSSLVNQAKRLGDTDGDKPYIRASDTYETVDATGVATELFGLGHNYYSSNPFILGDMLCAMAEANPDARALERRHYAGTPDGPEYYRVSAEVTPGSQDCSLFRDAFPLTSAAQAPDDRGRGMEPEPMYETAPPPPPPAAAPSMPESAPMAPRSLPPAGPETFSYTDHVEDRDTYDAFAISGELMLALNQGEPAAIYIDTYTDTVGSPEENLARTQAWAEAVRDVLVTLGASPEIITLTAHGEEDLAVSTEDEVDEPQNRRVEIRVEYE